MASHIMDSIDDMSIAHGLMAGPNKIPPRTVSFKRNTRGGTDESSELFGKDWSRLAINSSDTWTSSAGDVLSDREDVADRTDFLLEYNRLALKVRAITSIGAHTA